MSKSRKSAEFDVAVSKSGYSHATSSRNDRPLTDISPAKPNERTIPDISAFVGTADEFVSYSEVKECNVFKGTDTPVAYLFQSLLHGETFKDFMADFPFVKEEDILGVIRLAAQTIR